MPNSRSTSAVLLADIGKYSVNGWRSCMLCSQGSRSLRRRTVSSLFGTRITGLPSGTIASTLASSSVNLPASTMKITASTSDSADCTVRLRLRFIAPLWRFMWVVWKPGVSTKMNWLAPSVRMPVMRCRVVCALREVMLIFCPTRAFSSVLLPTLGRPTMATSPQRCGASCCSSVMGVPAAGGCVSCGAVRRVGRWP